MLNHQLPGYSPLRLRPLLSGIGGALVARRPGPQALADWLSAEYGARDCALTGSGTQALQLSLEICRDLPGSAARPVALPAYSCFDIVSAAVGAEVRVVFYDIDPRTLSPDPSSLARAAEAVPCAVVAGNLFGYPVDWAFLRSTADAVGAVLIEDAAQGLGSAWRGQPGGTHGDLTVLSFGRGKGWTGGGGGALLVRSPILGPPARARAAALPVTGVGTEVRHAALLGAQWALGRPGLYAIPMTLPGVGLGETTYKDPRLPTRMGRVASSVVLAHRGEATAEVGLRQDVAGGWVTRIEARCPNGEVQLCQPVADGSSSYLRLPLLLPDAATAASVAHRAKRHGVARGYPTALPDLAQIASRMAPAANETPGARILAERLVTLPTHSLVRDRDMERICAVLEAARSTGS
ncbi:MAG TPA: DegT/DnrJ/EryC1/StrS family aminotransferase [Longimicrobiales bacterium]|nr:DegT/DnrJ/EryC1/StrS family aminotransferase [Longimicrobiales bacterium]